MALQKNAKVEREAWSKDKPPTITSTRSSASFPDCVVASKHRHLLRRRIAPESAWYRMAVRRYQSGRRHSRCFSIDNSRADCTSWRRAQYYNLGRQQVRRFPPASRLRIVFTPATWQRFGFANGTFADVFGRREDGSSSVAVLYAIRYFGLRSTLRRAATAFSHLLHWSCVR